MVETPAAYQQKSSNKQQKRQGSVKAKREIGEKLAPVFVIYVDSYVKRHKLRALKATQYKLIPALLKVRPYSKRCIIIIFYYPR